MKKVKVCWTSSCLMFLIVLLQLGCSTLELRRGVWEYKHEGISSELPVFSAGDGDYKAYVYKHGVYHLKKNADGSFSPIRYEQFYDEHASYAEAEEQQFTDMKARYKAARLLKKKKHAQEQVIVSTETRPLNLDDMEDFDVTDSTGNSKKLTWQEKERLYKKLNTPVKQEKVAPSF